MATSTVTFDRARDDEQHAALSLVLRSVSPSARGPLVEAVAALPPERLGPLEGLVVARDPAGPLLGAAWVQPNPGRAASLWSPETTPRGATPEVVDGLLAEVLRRADAAGVAVVQALFEQEDDPRIAAALRREFVRVAELLYIGRSLRSRDAAPASKSGARFERYRPRDHERLQRAIAATYVGSLDCPAMEGRRQMEDVLVAYRATGAHGERDWRLVVDEESAQDVGVLLMAEHPGQQQHEIVYMGLAPVARGRGLGRRLVDEAVRLAATAGSEQVMAAVDAANTPARKAYESAGFAAWARRHVYVR